ncbi:lamin tail domain-containing protein [Streptomyces sp. NBC_00513]|uniref:lamin tail domain-containing protein n=1 Tax=unclassified Streptomyces TaxID=2593676 RepID=UPI0022562534|nr:lamin tail domain-containing protein [Streptomyces sp. NBC_00424]MCX5078655.1 lamin tail domain-containing protein [Streptomyces sp. NBC_00424]WUD39098.1 lamin tail domain-containing protein [Streptomyces sp. NBC_00513]WUD45631.1 lamin tail domain-containing protein [Streptomyces sp. NBC_00513]
MSVSSTTRRIGATVLAAGAIVSAAALPAIAADRGHDRHPRVEISRVQADSPGRDDHSNRSLNNEWVEIRNTTRQPVNLRGWTLRDADGNRYRFHDIRIAGRGTIRVHTGTGRDSRTDVFQGKREYIWGNRGDTATLRDDRGRTVDTESWGRRP